MERQTRWLAPPLAPIHARAYARGSLLWWLSLLVSTAIVIGVVGTLLAGGRLLSGRRGAGVNAGDLHGRMVISTVSSAGLRSPTGAAFSPDSASVAVVGSFAACGSQQTQGQACGHALAIYSSASGKLERFIPLERLLGMGGVAAFAQRSDRQTAPSADDVRFAGVGWSPDGARVALVFTVFSSETPSPESEVYSGLLVVDVVHATGWVFQGDSNYFGGPDATDPTMPVWSLTQAGAYAVPTLAPGLAYAWNDAGFPTTTIPLVNGASSAPSAVGPTSSVGNPDGGQTFSIWQPGMVIGPGSAGLSGDQSAFVTSFPAWSPDGDHVTLITAGVALAAPRHGLGAGAASPSAPAPPMPTPLLPAQPRDAALTAVQQQVGRAGWALVAWNPSGTTLASVSCFARNGQSLTLRDTSTGAVFGTTALGLQARPAGGQPDLGCQNADDGSYSAYPTPNLTLSWAPDGAQAMVADRDAATLTLWSVG